ncbi:MAG: hypothetical protein JOZ36_10845 [Acidobacteria bacterium]|nr:hypothetical protein [Acidobacteriota bacterium]
MKRTLSLMLLFVVLTFLGAWAQSDTTPSPSSTNQATSPTSSPSTQSNTQDSTSTRANPATSMSQSRTSLEGCLQRRESAYFLAPDHGQPVKLDSAQDLSQHVGHRVRLEGNLSNGGEPNHTYASSRAADNSTGTTARAAQSGQQADTLYQEMMVTRVDMISETCPAAGGTHNNTSQSPKGD